MDFFNFSTVVAFLLGGATGVWGYRYMAKNNPTLVAKWAADLKAAGKKLEATVNEVKGQ